MSYGYNPMWSEGAVKCPIFQTSTFVFKTAEDGKKFFNEASGRFTPPPGEEPGLIYSRLNNPDLEILEDRLTLWDEAEACVVFESGMAAISTTLLEFLTPGDCLLHSEPVYGGTHGFFKNVLSRLGITCTEFRPGETHDQIMARIKKEGAADKIKMIFIETPANPTNDLIDLECVTKLSRSLSTADKHVITVIDNTFLGPVYQHPIKHGIDLVIYSATKYIGGHSDVVAGACLGPKAFIKRIRKLRTSLGTMMGPWTSWLLMRSLETLKLRMERTAQTAQIVANYLVKHPKVERVYYLGLLKEGDPQYTIYKKQCLSPGAMISFDVKGGEHEAFVVLNSLKMIKLAVSLGGTESLAEHPASMTHADVDPDLKNAINITDKMIRLSVGVEDANDIIWDLEQALAKI